MTNNKTNSTIGPLKIMFALLPFALGFFLLLIHFGPTNSRGLFLEKIWYNENFVQKNFNLQEIEEIIEIVDKNTKDNLNYNANELDIRYLRNDNEVLIVKVSNQEFARHFQKAINNLWFDGHWSLRILVE